VVREFDIAVLRALTPDLFAKDGALDLSGQGIMVADLVCTTTEYTASTTWTMPENFIGLYCEAQGGGGGGGGVDVGVGESATGGGGAGGAYEAKAFRKRELTRTEAITIGAAGAAGASTGGNGGDGGDTSFGSYVVAPGGKGGGGATTDGGTGAAGAGGSASGSQVNRSGDAGLTAVPLSPILTAPGGNSALGWGGKPRLAIAGEITAALAGRDGTGFGAGGGGAAAAADGTGRAGGAGTAGKLILHVWTYSKT